MQSISGPASGDDKAAWTTQQGTIRKGMNVLDANGTCLGTVVGLEGEELLLDGPGETFIALSLIDGVSPEAVLLAPRGDATFGLGAQP